MAEAAAAVELLGMCIDVCPDITISGSCSTAVVAGLVVVVVITDVVELAAMGAEVVVVATAFAERAGLHSPVFTVELVADVDVVDTPHLYAQGGIERPPLPLEGRGFPPLALGRRGVHTLGQVDRPPQFCPQ